MRGASSSIANVAGRNGKRERLHSLKIKEGIHFQGEQLLMNGKVCKWPFEMNVLLASRKIALTSLHVANPLRVGVSSDAELGKYAECTSVKKIVHSFSKETVHMSEQAS